MNHRVAIDLQYNLDSKSNDPNLENCHLKFVNFYYLKGTGGHTILPEVRVCIWKGVRRGSDTSKNVFFKNSVLG